MALEEQRVPYRLIDTTFRRWDPQYWKSFSVELLQGTVHAVLRRARERFDIIEIAAHHLRSALQALRVKEPAAHIVLYRTAWTCQILVSNQAFSTEDIPP